MPSRALFRRPGVLLALALCSVGGVVTILGHLATGPQLEQKRVPLATEAGTKAYAAFSPDGQRLAYSARTSSKVGVFHIFVRAVTTDTPRQLTDGAGNDTSPVWSPDGKSIAFLRNDGDSARYLVVPAEGGAERQIAEFPVSGDEAQPAPSVSWLPDGNSLAIVQTSDKQPPAIALTSLDGRVTRLTNPPEGSEGDAMPAASPDGSGLAFVRTSAEGADIFLCDAKGANVRRLTFDDHPIRGIAWTHDGHDLVYSSARIGGGFHLWRLPAFGGSPHELSIAGKQAQYPAIAPAGNRLVYSDSPSVSAIWRATLGTGDTFTEDRPLLRSNGREFWPMYSPDGKKIADFCNETGGDEIWISDADGGNRRKLTDMKNARMSRLRWSPDSKMLVFDAAMDRGADLYVIPAAGGAPKRVVVGASNASWSNDGKRIYFQMRGQIWKASADGGNLEPIARQMGAAQPVESPDGKYIYYRLRRSIWRVPSTGGEGEEAIMPDQDMIWSTTLQVSRNGLYFLEFERGTRTFVVSLYDFKTGKISAAFHLKGVDFGAATFSISPDGRTVLYPRVDQSQTDLMLVENFK